MLGKIGNILGKGATTAVKVAAGSFGFGALVAITNWHPTGVEGMLWYGGGITIATGVIGSIVRWAQFDPSKVK